METPDGSTSEASDTRFICARFSVSIQRFSCAVQTVEPVLTTSSACVASTLRAVTTGSVDYNDLSRQLLRPCLFNYEEATTAADEHLG